MQGQSTRVALSCVYCGKGFSAWPSRVRDGQKFCSRTCMGLANRTSLTVACGHCGKRFFVEPNQVRRGAGKFCSRACLGAARRGKSKVPLVERFWSKVDKDGPIPEHRPELGPCWLWTGSLNPEGYGGIQGGGRNIFAHRLGYELANGPTPAGLELDHLCRVRRCVRPTHMEAVTHRVNSLRGSSPSAIAWRGGTCTKGHPMTPENTYAYPNHGRRWCKTCTRERDRARALRQKARESA